MERNVWRKATRSGNNGQCVEVAELTNAVAVRDSKDQGGPILAFSPAGWDSFINGTKAGQFDAR